jgi:hypothetical protein
MKWEKQESLVRIYTQIDGIVNQIVDSENGDTLRDCRKSPKIAILAISQLIKSITYEHQNHRFRVFRQSLRITQLWQFYRYERNITRFFRRGMESIDAKVFYLSENHAFTINAKLCHILDIFCRPK